MTDCPHQWTEHARTYSERFGRETGIIQVCALCSGVKRVEVTTESLGKVTAERDELLSALFRLPAPPPEDGDSPDERVGYALRLIQGLRARVFSLACSECGEVRSRYCPTCGRPMAWRSGSPRPAARKEE